MSKLRDSLKNVRDMERLTGRISQGAGNARDLQALASSLDRIPALRDDLESLPGGGEMLESIRSRMGRFDELVDLLQRALVDEPPVTIKEGGIIRRAITPGWMSCAWPPATARHGWPSFRRRSASARALIL